MAEKNWHGIYFWYFWVPRKTKRIPYIHVRLVKCYITLNLSAMKPNDLTAEISALEAQLQHHQNLLDKAFSDNREFAETKVIFHEVKIITDKLILLKSSGSPSQLSTTQ